MAKPTKDELKKKVAEAKEATKAARTELRSFEKENSLEKGGDHSTNEKVGKKWSKLNAPFVKAKAKQEEAEKALADLKAEGNTGRSTYDYPKEITSAGDKKKYRAKMRAAAKKAAKGEAAGEGKKDKTGKGEKAGSKEGKGEDKKSKKSKKGGKDKGAEGKEAAEETED